MCRDDDLRIDRQRRIVAAQPIERHRRLEAEEPVGIVERGGQRVDRRGERQQRQRRRHVAADPDVFFAIAHEVGERRDHRLAVADQHRARRRLQPPVAQQRHQRRHEQEIAGAERAGAFDRGPRHVEVRVVHQRHEHRPERGVLDVAERARHLQPPFGALLARVARESPQRLFGDRDVVGIRCCRRAPRRRRSRARDRCLVMNGRITSTAASPRSTASADTAAMRTALSGSFSARSTPGSQRSASAGPADFGHLQRARANLRRCRATAAAA